MTQTQVSIPGYKVSEQLYDGLRTLLQILIISAKSPKQLHLLTVGLLKRSPVLEAQNEHGYKTPISIQVLWRDWLKLHDKSEGL